VFGEPAHENQGAMTRVGCERQHRRKRKSMRFPKIRGERANWAAMQQMKRGFG
jgi:hypothetical protein